MVSIVPWLSVVRSFERLLDIVHRFRLFAGSKVTLGHLWRLYSDLTDHYQEVVTYFPWNWLRKQTASPWISQDWDCQGPKCYANFDSKKIWLNPGHLFGSKWLCTHPAVQILADRRDTASHHHTHARCKRDSLSWTWSARQSDTARASWWHLSILWPRIPTYQEGKISADWGHGLGYPATTSESRSGASSLATSWGDSGHSCWLSSEMGRPTQSPVSRASG